MSDLSESAIRSALSDVIRGDAISAIVIDDGSVGIVLDFGSDKPADAGAVRARAEAAVKGMPGVSSVNVVMTAAKAPPAMPSGGMKLGAHGTPPPPKPTTIPGVRHVVAVASGKGGVGKSTTSVNLALALRDLGLSVGILDADIFGPSLPMLLGINEKPSLKDGMIQPILSHGVKAMSIGLLIDIDQPVVWRGPRVMGATQQLLKEVAWGPLDVLIVDMPPGTGDVQLTMVQQATLSGAVIVSTPQDLALIDARKGLAMFRKVNVPILGIVENMSSYLCPACGHEAHIFGHGGAAEAASELDAPFLGGIPLDMKIRLSADEGNPIVESAPDSPEAAAYRRIAKAVAASLNAVPA
ncbi:Mrp/NBP35 family ATP-binding protein [Gimibacter soli]|uniref:Iron-sulfur cluster carrier protein n=1 Tax=Gimibacter soli TaxID=3024400 RepID=A0AAF0BLL0_9PROT|nr:Mrp/NBP35 family ATP-binding protein [Gimibacter soli]WCL53565.1 Mrp/NBP35 family ATP-binding protein [Gimibacter soli]